jgi:hypothetical protein
MSSIGSRAVARTLAVLVSTIAGRAGGETVRFQSATAPPSALRMQMAQANASATVDAPSDEIAGELDRPAGPGPFPAVVALHGCNGPPSPRSMRAIVEQFVGLVH